MITDIPTKQDFYSTADHMVNEAWEKVADLSYAFNDLLVWNKFCIESEHFSDDDVVDLEQYWSFVRPKLITALSLVLQSVEFRLKGLIVDVSPYLLLTSVVRNIPRNDEQGNISFSQFHTLDAQDLIKVLGAFSMNKLSDEFIEWYKEMRILRNKFMHTVDMKSDITAELIFKSIIFAHNNLNPDSPHWIWHRYNYKAIHSANGINFKGAESGLIHEMLQTHLEITGAISVSSDSVCKIFFGYDKNKTGYHCKECVSVMQKSEHFDGKHIEGNIETIQYNRKTRKYVCIFCHHTQSEKPGDIWEHDE